MENDEALIKIIQSHETSNQERKEAFKKLYDQYYKPLLGWLHDKIFKTNIRCRIEVVLKLKGMRGKPG